MKSILFSKRLARGPAHAHAFVESLYDHEDFCLQSDSHVGVIQVSHLLPSLFISPPLCRIGMWS
jgi:hypothetical protein